eukprot:g1672.t1
MNVFDNLILLVCEEAFIAPKLAVESPLLSKGSKSRSKQLDVVESSVLASFSLLLSLRTILPHTSGDFVDSLMDRLWTVIDCRVPELSTKVYEILIYVFKGQHGSGMDILKVDQIVERLMMEFNKLETHEWKLTLSLMDAIHTIVNCITTKNFSLAIEKLSTVLPLLFTKMFAEHNEIRKKSQFILVNLIEKLLSTHGVYKSMNENLIQDALAKLCQSIAQVSTDVFVQSIDILSPVLKSLFSALGRTRSFLAGSIVVQLGSLHDAIVPNEDSGVQQDQPSELGVVIESLLGNAVTSMGTELVLHYLPLKLKEALDGQMESEPRTWLLPILKRSISADYLLYWINEFLPMAKEIEIKSKNLLVKDEEMLFKLKVLEKQIWQLLPSFCQMPLDLPQAYPILSGTLREAFSTRTELQDSIALAMSRLWKNSMSIVEIAMESPEIESQNLTDFFERLTLEVELYPRDASTSDVISTAKNSVESFQKDGIEWFDTLASVLLSEDKKMSSILYTALTSLSMVFNTKALKFIQCKLLSRIQEVFMKPSNADEQASHLDLLYVLLQAMDTNSIQQILRLVEMILQSNVSDKCQKKAYKVLYCILEQRKESWTSKLREMCILLNSLTATCRPSSLHFRIGCLGELLCTVVEQEPDNEDAIISFLPEIIFSLEGQSKKVQLKSKEYLKKLAMRYSQRGRFDALLKLIQFGLSSPDVDVILATIRSLNHLMEYYSILFIEDLPALLRVILDFACPKDSLTSNFISSVLEFIQKTTSILSVEILELNLEGIVEFLLGADAIPMKKSQEEVKAILALLGEKLSFAKLQHVVPKEYSRVLRNLRYAHRLKLRRNEASAESVLSCETSTKVPQSTLTKLMNLSINEEKEEEVEDLLEPSEARKLARVASGVKTEIEEDLKEPKFELPTNSEGKIVISERTLKNAQRKMSEKAKRIREHGSESGMTSKSNKRTKKSESHFRHGSRMTPSKSHISGARFKSKKGAGGDAKGKSRFEPFAYWKFDRRLLNKRRGKQNVARRDLKQVTNLRSS